MNLVVFARSEHLDAEVAAIEAWVAALRGSTDGEFVRRNFEEEFDGPDGTRTASALRALVVALGGDQPSAAAKPVDWLFRLVKAHPEYYLCQGRDIPVDATTTTLGRKVSLGSFFRRYCRHDLAGLEDVVDATTGNPLDENVFRDWAYDNLEDTDTSGLQDILDVGAAISGLIPTVFAFPQIDQETFFPKGTDAVRLFEILGVDYEAVDQCLFFFDRTSTGCEGHVPTAFDAFKNGHFLGVSVAEEWGWTRDLAVPRVTHERGVRECVLRPFRVSSIRRCELVVVR